jgi:hypothetical protein
MVEEEEQAGLNHAGDVQENARHDEKHDASPRVSSHRRAMIGAT